MFYDFSLQTTTSKWEHFIYFIGIRINEETSEMPIKPVPFISFNITDRTIAEKDNNKTYSLRWNGSYSQNRTIFSLTDNSFFFQDATLKPESRVEFQVSKIVWVIVLIFKIKDHLTA